MNEDQIKAHTEEAKGGVEKGGKAVGNQDLATKGKGSECGFDK